MISYHTYVYIILNILHEILSIFAFYFPHAHYFKKISEIAFLIL